MSWKKADLAHWAGEMDVNLIEIDQKLKLCGMVMKVRAKRGLTQAEVAELVGVSRSRIAQIEAGVRLHKMSFDILLRVLQGLGCRYTISAKRLAA